MPKEKKLQPPQHQDRQPGREYKMKPRPRAEDEKHRGSRKLQDKVALLSHSPRKAPIFQSFISKNGRMRMKPSSSLKNTGIDAC